MQTSLIVQSNGTGKEDLEDLLEQGWAIVDKVPNNGPSYNDYLVILEK